MDAERLVRFSTANESHRIRVIKDSGLTEDKQKLLINSVKKEFEDGREEGYVQFLHHQFAPGNITQTEYTRQMDILKNTTAPIIEEKAALVSKEKPTVLIVEENSDSPSE